MKFLHYYLLVILIVLASGAVAFGDGKEPDRSLYFTTLYPEQKLDLMGGPAIQNIETEDVCMVTPVVGAAYSAKKIAPHTAWCTLAGDENGDGIIALDPPLTLTDHIDALLLLEPLNGPGGLHPTMRELAFSPSVPLGGAVSGSTMLRGDVARIVGNGQYEYFLRAQQIVNAFGIAVAPAQINVDAIAYHYDPDPSARMIYLSLELDRVLALDFTGVLLNYWAADGSILCIPGSAVTAWTANGGVQSVTPNSGLIVQFEPEVDNWVVNAVVADSLGGQAMQIGDVDGLVLDPNGGMITTMWGTYHNLFFSGSDAAGPAPVGLTGGGVLSTSGGGVIAHLNGQQLACPFPGMTDGSQVGLFPVAPSSLNGLEVTPEHCRFVLDGQVTYLPGGGAGTIEFAGASNMGTYMLISLCPGPVAMAVNAPVVFNGHCFPQYFVPLLPGGLVPIDVTGLIGPSGYGIFAFAVGPIAPPGAFPLVVQAYANHSGDWRLSTPMTVQF
jgi:hypothetical protein